MTCARPAVKRARWGGYEPRKRPKLCERFSPTPEMATQPTVWFQPVFRGKDHSQPPLTAEPER